MRDLLKYNFSNAAIVITVLLSVIISYYFNWHGNSMTNFAEGDAKDYYSYLPSIFIHHNLNHQSTNDWFVMQTANGTVNVHPAGVSLMLLPFFALACLFATVFNFPVDGLSFPFQLAIATGALFYAISGLIFLKKMLKQNSIPDKVTALILLLTFFGTFLLNYTISEAAMSHVYSFSLISGFLYYSNSYILNKQNRHLFICGLLFGLIVLVRPNNAFILFSVLFWFRNTADLKSFFKDLFRTRTFYYSVIAVIAIVSIQSIIWYMQSRQLFHHTYKADGFYWLNPQIIAMLFGFDGGFFIYVPLCLLFMAGLIVVYRESKFRFVMFSLFFAGLFYFFASYWAYTYFDGLGIRVLVDYYALFSFLGAKLFTQFLINKPAFIGLLALATCLTVITFIYCYQQKNGILFSSNMNFNKWKYTFLRTGEEYKNCLGGCSDITPYSTIHPAPSCSKSMKLDTAYNFRGNEYGAGIAFDSIGFNSNRLHLKIDISRTEEALNSSKDAIVCVTVEDKPSVPVSSFLFRLNETPSIKCCDTREYHYSVNLMGQYKKHQRLIVYIWNMAKKSFLLNKFSVQLYNYNYQIN